MSARLVVLTGPIGAGKNTVADLLADRLRSRGQRVAVVDVDEVADGSARHDWPTAHRVHGALVAAWLREGVDVVAVGPVVDAEEQRALLHPLPEDADVLWVVLDAPVEITFARVQDDPTRGRSKERGFHHDAHARFRRLVGGIPAGLRIDTARVSAAAAADLISEELARLPLRSPSWRSCCFRGS